MRPNKYRLYKEAPDDPLAEHMVRDVVCVRPQQDLHDVIEAIESATGARQQCR